MLHSTNRQQIGFTAVVPASRLAGCVSQSVYDQLQEQNRQLQATTAQLERSLAAAQAQITRLRIVTQ